MNMNGRLGRLSRIVLLVAFAVSAAAAVEAQTSADLETLLTPGMTVWISGPDAEETRARIVGVSGDIVTTVDGEFSRRFRTTDIVRVRVRDSDSLINGALIGAGAAVASGLFLCSLTESWENCRDDVGPMLRIGTIGAGFGIGIDALIRKRKTIYEAAPRSIALTRVTALHVRPIVARNIQGLRVSVAF